MTKSIILSTFLICCVIARAQAHGDAQWIADGSYVGIDGAHCCGVSDCEIAPPGAVERVPEGWRVVKSGQVFKDGERGVYEDTAPTTEGNLSFWWCRMQYGQVAGMYRCLFFPQTAG